MEITSVGMNYNNLLVRSETIKQASANEQQEVNTSQTNEVITDTFTKSAAADEISNRAENLPANATLETTGAKETETQSAAVQIPPSMPIPSAKVNTEATDANTNAADNAGTETTKNTAVTVTSVSEYTAAEIAEYDLNGDGEIDASEEARMIAAQAELTAKAADEAKEGLSIEQMEAKEAYENAKNQLLPAADESVINEQF